MIFTTNSTSSVEGCDALLQMANNDKAKLELRQTILTAQRTSNANSTTSRQQELGQLNADLLQVLDKIQALPEGEEKSDQIQEKMRLEYRIYVLNRRVEGDHSTDLLEKEYDMATVEKELEAANEFIAAINARKLELAA